MQNLPLTFDCTLIPLLRISIFCHFGSTSFVLPIRPKDGILNRGIRVVVIVCDNKFYVKNSRPRYYTVHTKTCKKKVMS